MIKYFVRSRQLIDLVGDVKRRTLILAPYFQRNLVWRLVHKQDFIKTILLGYPFPQIFLAKGGIDVDQLSSISLVVDGQQRLNSIIEFIEDKFEVDERLFSDFDKDEKDNFLTYEIAIIELQMESDNPEMKEVFKRLNRTFYSLTNIEKLSTEYAPSELMLVAKLLAKDIQLKNISNNHSLDPNVPESFIKWAQKKKVDSFHKLIFESSIFTPYETARKVHLMIILNILATIERGFFNRNIPTQILDDYANSFPEKDLIVDKLEKVAKIYNSLSLPNSSYWFNKANFFSLCILMYNNLELFENIASDNIVRNLLNFENSISEQYQLAAKEAVNNKKERQLRDTFLTNLFFEK